MGRRFQDILRFADGELSIWGEWTARHIERSPIGYPKSSTESRAGEAKAPPCSAAIVPNVMMPARVALVDRLIRDAETPTKYRCAIVVHYVHQKAAIKHDLREARIFIAGGLRKA